MKTCLFALILSTISPSLYAQDLPDSLGKYSYLVQIDKRCEQAQATGFFVRYQQRLFFITAAHCLTGWDPVAMKPIENFPDTIFIRLSNDTSQLTYLPLPVRGFKKTVKPFNQFETPDVFVVEIKNAKKYKVNTIETFFDEEVPCEKATKLVVSGFPKVKLDSSDYMRMRQQPFTLSASVDATYCIYPYRPDVKLYDRLHYYTSFDDKTTGKGLSGAPVYVETDNETIVFGGIFIGDMQQGSGRSMIVRSEYVINKIMARIYRE
jgi:hypothetical protein